MQKTFLKVPHGQEKWAFLYVVISVIAIAGATTYGWINHLVWWQIVLLWIGCLLGAWATLFSFLELRGLQEPAKDVEEADPYAARTLAVNPPTAAPYPHHEDYPESAGFDQSQLTARIPDTTPFVEGFFNRRKQKPAH